MVRQPLPVALPDPRRRRQCRTTPLSGSRKPAWRLTAGAAQTRPAPVPVPELTRSADIQLNKRVSLRRRAERIGSHQPDNSPASGPSMAKPPGVILRLAALFCALKTGHHVDARPHNLARRRPFLSPALKSRTIINRGALMFFAGQAGVHACCVRDVTNGGAGIRLSGLDIMPSEFGVSFDNFRTMRLCRLKWRDGDFVGVTFDT